jgi:hypothetical protein
MASRRLDPKRAARPHRLAPAKSRFFKRLRGEKKKAASSSDAAKVGRKRLKSGVTGETSHEHVTNMEHCFPDGKRNLMMNK